MDKKETDRKSDEAVDHCRTHPRRRSVAKATAEAIPLAAFRLRAPRKTPRPWCRAQLHASASYPLCDGY